MSEWKEYTLGELTTDGKGTYGTAASAVDYCAELPTYYRHNRQEGLYLPACCIISAMSSQKRWLAIISSIFRCMR